MEQNAKRSLSAFIASTVLLCAIKVPSGDNCIVQATAVDDVKKSISTINIITENLIEPACDYVTHPDNCVGDSIINNEYVDCSMEYIDPNGETTTIVDESAKIKIRGNSSAYGDKKPYKLKLSKKQSFSTSESSKKWILLKDGTNLKFLFSNWASEYCGMEWQPEFEYVNVTLNGDYKGCYILAESVEQITKNLPFDDYGFLVENDAYWWNEGDDYFKVDNQVYSMGFTFKVPEAEDLTEEETDYIIKKVNTAANSIIKFDNKEYLSYIDGQCFASWFLAKDYMGNTDPAGSNMYWYSTGRDDLIKLGPIWDYSGDYRAKADDWSYVHTYRSNFGNNIFKKSSFKKLYRNQYEKTKNICTELTSYINGYLDTYGASLQESWNSDAERWNRTANSVDTKKKSLLEWYSQRNEWLNEATTGWSLDFSQYDIAVNNAKSYDASLYENYDVLQAALDVDVYDVDFTQEELDNTTLAIQEAIDGLVLKNPNLIERAGAPYKIVNNAYVYDVTVPHIIINQVYGGKKKESYASNSFIELYNPTSKDVDLNGWSLQYRSSIDGGSHTQWSKLDLDGIIASHCSYLVRCGSVKNPSEGAVTISNYDKPWDQVINNKGISVILLDDNMLIDADSVVYDNDKCKPAIANYVDMFAVSGNDTVDETVISNEAALYYEKSASRVQSKKSTIRRIGFKDTDNNSVEGDFEEIDYSFIVPDYREYIRPRSSSDGAWTAADNPRPVYTVTLNTNGGSSIDPIEVEASEMINSIPDTTKDEYIFNGWFTDELCSTPCEFPYRPTVSSTLYAGWKKEPSFERYNLVLSGKMGVNFYLDLSSLTEKEKSESYMEFTVNGKTAKDSYDPSFMNASGQYYGFTYYITAVEMADTITAIYHYGDGQTITKTYSVLDYINKVEEKAGVYDEKALALVRSIADYGHYSQPFLAANNNWTVGKEHKEMTKYYTDSYSYDTIKKETSEFQRVVDIGKSDINSIAFSLSLKAETTLNVFIKPNSDYNGSIKITARNDNSGKTYDAVKQADGRYKVTIPNISVYQLGDTYSITAVTTNGTATCSLSALSYAYAILSGSSYDKTAKNAVSAFFKYYDAAMNYRNK